MGPRERKAPLAFPAEEVLDDDEGRSGEICAIVAAAGEVYEGGGDGGPGNYAG